MEPTAGQGSSSKIILSIIVILVIAAIAFAMARGGGETDETATTTDDVVTDESVFSGDIFNLVARGGDWRCIWSSEQDGIDLDGTVFVSRGKFKSDVELSGVGMNATAHAIGDGQFVYSWSSAATTGVRFPMTQGATALEVSGSNAQNLQFSGEYTYDCDPWTADSGTFALPSGVTFQDVATVN
ncbi:MAG TPA: hypothetical protein VJ837_05865 [Candidatus Paceibacterota bacterium]|nr:hypothetical protein [Candidatus Paceibacterota bacterium]